MNDFIFAWRRLLKNKVTSAAAILSLAVALGAVLSVFQLIDALLLRPLPVAEPNRLYVLTRQGYDGWEYPVFTQLRDAVSSDATLLAISYAERADITYRADDEVEKAHVQYLSGNTFETFGLHAALGRLFTGQDDLKPGAHPVAVISHDYWTRRFGKDPEVIGRTFRLSNNLVGARVYQIIGVVDAGFTGTEPGNVVDIFMPAMMHWGVTEARWSVFRTLVHLRPLIAPGAVLDRLSVVLHSIAPKRSITIEPAAVGVSVTQKNYRTSLLTLGVLVALVLLIASANVANLMTARGAARAREMALRISIGAGRWRLVRLVLVESALIGIAASAISCGFAAWAAPFVLGRVNPPDDPARVSLAMDWRVLAFGLSVALGVTLLFGLAPALRASAIDPVAALKGGDDLHGRSRWMRISIAFAAALCFVVLFTAGLFVSTFERLSGQSTGFPTGRLLAITIVTPRNEPASVWEQVTERVRSTQGVESAAYADWPLLDGWGFKTNALSINGSPPTDIPAWFLNVSPGWIGTMKIPLIAGRDFRSSDFSPGAALVNETFAKQYFSGENPIGKWFEGTSSWMGGQRFQIVGVVGDARYRYLRQPIVPVAYTPFQRMSDMGKVGGGALMVRTATPNPLALSSILKLQIRRARPDFRIDSIRTESELIANQYIRERLLAMLARFFASVALLLAGVGLYGVVDYSVIQRRREIGIRMALGAGAAHVARRVTGGALAMVLVGSVAGLTVGLALVRYIQSLLYQAKPTDLRMLAMPSLIVIGASLAAVLPAVLHAVRIDPAALLREE